MKGKWASGIAPRNFAWIIKDRLAISERPGGYARSHRPVRRQEEIIWIREQGFARVVSLLSSPHNLHAYDELGVAWEHIPLPLHEDPRIMLGELYPKLSGQLLGLGPQLTLTRNDKYRFRNFRRNTLRRTQQHRVIFNSVFEVSDHRDHRPPAQHLELQTLKCFTRVAV